jgi:hypothetical protein
VHTEADVSRAWAELGGRPSLIKLGFGAVACGVYMVRTKESAREKFRELQTAMGGQGTHSEKLAIGERRLGEGPVFIVKSRSKTVNPKEWLSSDQLPDMRVQ